MKFNAGVAAAALSLFSLVAAAPIEATNSTVPPSPIKASLDINKRRDSEAKIAPSNAGWNVLPGQDWKHLSVDNTEQVLKPDDTSGTGFIDMIKHYWRREPRRSRWSWSSRPGMSWKREACPEPESRWNALAGVSWKRDDYPAADRHYLDGWNNIPGKAKKREAGPRQWLDVPGGVW
ncbi:hypothetical protein K461DRAFT_296227 [Myriangium duriaei CBS 260.36]|uniref:Uncharacterized protein n=1 Tax=Myriangium duriaei CBS 260.36 TaxID=1168546 RepID=A0A9P4MHA1_9PEZI|nr:hypothetical protein K461DRAFT_296227 [Myriangium duriaei CBS 260.36]